MPEEERPYDREQARQYGSQGGREAWRNNPKGLEKHVAQIVSRAPALTETQKQAIREAVRT